MAIFQLSGDLYLKGLLPPASREPARSGAMLTRPTLLLLPIEVPMLAHSLGLITRLS